MGEEKQVAATFCRCWPSVLITSACGIALGLCIDWFPTQASTQAKKIDTLWDVLLIVSVPVFVLVETVVLYSVWKFRMRPGEELKDGPPIHGNTRLEVIWTAIPAIMLVALCTYAYVVLHDIEKAAGRTRCASASSASSSRGPSTTAARAARRSPRTQLYLPEGQAGEVHGPVQGRPARLLGPGLPHEDRRRARASRPTTASRRPRPARSRSSAPSCAGSGTPSMRQTAHVVTPAAFDKWLAEAGQRRPAGGRRRRRRRRRRSAGRQDDLHQAASRACGACHTLADAGTTGTTGPDLDKVLKGKDATFIQQSIEDPNAEIAKRLPGGIMPPNYKADPPAGGDQGADRLPCEGTRRSDGLEADGGEDASTGVDRAAGEFTVLGVLFAFALVTVVRARLRLLEPVRRRRRLGHEVAGRDPDRRADRRRRCSSSSASARFDYWFYWAAGTPTRPEDHSATARTAGRTTSGSTPTTR